ncbi:hypothetical protein BDP55DRAFT_632436 [Colletotrichum godetiae]|uniref:Uncharacterized protein n=1 Tax=Colletotrichum godetiae TaxID=1209918 RepID=A0AAJ0AJZ0_9PEZI|nr:uncharacterized protein BDP55DRAFT_632436 [Colletotrichum godetiae]KAK1675267.1 hypothetical protein BDP55DRAFT_632436 [Colletotrichum godetiae]
MSDSPCPSAQREKSPCLASSLDLWMPHYLHVFHQSRLPRQHHLRLTNPLSVIDRGTPRLTPSSDDPSPQVEVHIQHHGTASQDSLKNRPRPGTQCSAGLPQSLAAPRPRRRVPSTAENRPIPSILRCITTQNCRLLLSPNISLNKPDKSNIPHISLLTSNHWPYRPWYLIGRSHTAFETGPPASREISSKRLAAQAFCLSTRQAGGRIQSSTLRSVSQSSNILLFTTSYRPGPSSLPRRITYLVAPSTG